MEFGGLVTIALAFRFVLPKDLANAKQKLEDGSILALAKTPQPEQFK